MVKAASGKHGIRLRQNAQQSKSTAEENARSVDEARRDGSNASHKPDVTPSRKLQNKIKKRVSFHERVAQSSLAAKPRIKKARRKRSRTGAALGDLNSLSAALGVAEREVAAKKERRLKGLSVGGAKKRKKINTEETVRLQQVLAHPDFKRDPLAAVASHLESSLPPLELPKTQNVAQRLKNVNGSRRQKLKKQKARDEMQS